MAVECSICLESLELTQDLSVVCCGHLFHSECISDWIDSTPNCPKCRKGTSGERLVKIFVEAGNPDGASNASVADLRAENAFLHDLLDEQLTIIAELERGITTGAGSDASSAAAAAVPEAELGAVAAVSEAELRRYQAAVRCEERRQKRRAKTNVASLRNKRRREAKRKRKAEEEERRRAQERENAEHERLEREMQRPVTERNETRSREALLDALLCGNSMSSLHVSSPTTDCYGYLLEGPQSSLTYGEPAALPSTLRGRMGETLRLRGGERVGNMAEPARPVSDLHSMSGCVTDASHPSWLAPFSGFLWRREGVDAEDSSRRGGIVPTLPRSTRPDDVRRATLLRPASSEDSDVGGYRGYVPPRRGFSSSRGRVSGERMMDMMELRRQVDILARDPLVE